MQHTRIPLRAALFDLGGVILSSPFEAFARYERDNGLPEGAIRSVNARNIHDNAWARLERGEIGVDVFAQAFTDEAREMGLSIDGAHVLGLLAGEVRPEMVTAVERCAEHLRTGLLTNNFQVGDGALGLGAGLGRVMSLFDVVVESSKVGLRKPDPRFYEFACDRLGIEPAEAVFLDDLGVNLKPARAMGMHTIKVVDPATALRELEEVVGFPVS